MSGTPWRVAFGTCSTWFGAPNTYHEQPLYDVICFKILPQSPSVTQDLAELGLAGSYTKLIGTNAYSPGSPASDPEWLAAFSARTSYLKLGSFYMYRRPFTIRLAEDVER